VTDDELRCKIACSDLLITLADALDNDNAEAAAACFADNATMLLPNGSEVAGNGIAAAFGARPRAIVTRHLVTNILIHPGAGDTARSSVTILVYRVPRANPDTLPRVLPETPQAIGQWHTEYKKTSAGWRISRHTTEALLVPAA
jgi:hypothetical protein